MSDENLRKKFERYINRSTKVGKCFAEQEKFMPDILTLLLGTFALYILLYGVCWGTDKTDIEKYKKKIKLNKYTSILFFCGQGMKKYIG